MRSVVALAVLAAGCSLVNPPPRATGPEPGLIAVDPPGAADGVPVAWNDGALDAASCPAGTGAGCNGLSVLAACFPNADGGYDLCELATDGSGERRTVGLGPGAPLPSPDGQRVIVVQNQRAPRLARIDGTPLVDPLPARTGWFGADQLIARTAANDGFQLLDLTGQVLSSVADDPGFEAKPNERVFPSPDHRSFLVTPITPEVGRRVWLHVLGRGGWERFDFGPGALQIGSPPNWSPDGATIYATVQTAVGDDARPGDLRSELRAIDVATRQYRVVARFSHLGALSGVLSPDGRLMAERGETALVVVDVATGAASARLATGTTNQFPSVVWSPASDHLALEIDNRIALVAVGADLALRGPSPLSAGQYQEAFLPLWPRPASPG